MSYENAKTVFFKLNIQKLRFINHQTLNANQSKYIFELTEFPQKIYDSYACSKHFRFQKRY